MKRLILVSAFLALSFLVGCDHSALTKNQVDLMLAKAGGVQEIDREVQLVFEVFGTNDVVILKALDKSQLSNYPEMTNRPGIHGFPALFSLGDTVELLAGASNAAPRLWIRFGTHSQAKNIYIFQEIRGVNDADSNPDISHLRHDNDDFEIAPNIFFMK